MMSCLACFSIGLGAGTILGCAFLFGVLWVAVKLFGVWARAGGP